MLNRRLHFRLCCIALLLLFNEFLNFCCVHSRWHQTTVLYFPCLNHTLNLGFDVTICEVLLLQKKLRVFAPQ